VNGKPFRSEMMKMLKVTIFVLTRISFHIPGKNFLCQPLVKLGKTVTSQFHRAAELSDEQS